MSWLARSIANSLRLDEDDGEDEDEDSKDGVRHCTTSNTPKYSHPQTVETRECEKTDEGGDCSFDYRDDWIGEGDDRVLDNQGRGVKEDLSEFRETITRQLWGVASFLAPPPSLNPNRVTDRQESRCERWGYSGQSDVSDEDEPNSVGNSTFRNDFSHVDGNISNSISNVSHFLPCVSEHQLDDAVGITDEVLAFARNIAHHPETWLDFPLSEEEDMDDFDLSDAQQKHALAVEHLSPRLAALRIELCPAHLSVGYFWKVYFVLLHSRLNKHDAEQLSTPQVVEARAMWMQELQKRTKPESDWYGQNTFHSKESNYSRNEDFGHNVYNDAPGKFAFESKTCSGTFEYETVKLPIISSEVEIIDKSVIKEERVVTGVQEKVHVTSASSSKALVLNYDDDDDEDDWLKEHPELDGYSGTAFLEGNEEDVSFSDLEDDVDCTMPIKSNAIPSRLGTSTKTS